MSVPRSLRAFASLTDEEIDILIGIKEESPRYINRSLIWNIVNRFYHGYSNRMQLRMERDAAKRMVEDEERFKKQGGEG